MAQSMGRRSAWALCVCAWLLLGISGVVVAQTNGAANADPDADVILNEIVAKVNTEIITLTDLDAELRRARRGIEAQTDDPAARTKRWDEERPEILRNMIYNRLLAQRAEEFGMTPKIDEELNAIISRTISEANIPDLETFKKILIQQGTTYEDYRIAIRERLILQIMQQQFVFSKVTVLGDEVEAYYQAHLDQFIEPPEVEVAEIVLLTEGKSKAQVRTKADDILSRLKSGESFEDLARNHSEGATASDGGTIGTFKKGQMAPILEEPIFALKAGEITDVIEADYGFVIMKQISSKPATPRPLEDVRLQILRFLQGEKAAPYMKTFLDSLRSESFVWVAPKYQKQFNVADLI